MSERKVLNKYYPPDFDPSKIPRLHLPKDRQYTVRLMAPCNMRCKTCGEYIYKGKKFNARKETVQGEDYLGIKIFRFYIKCTRCLAEITFKTDPQNADYIVEHGATRNFQALKLAEEQAEREQREEEEEEASNPMKLLEKRTKASKYEMETLEKLEELKELNQRQANVDYDTLLGQNAELQLKAKRQQEEEDEALIQSVFGRKTVNKDEDDDDDEDEIVEDYDDDDEEVAPEFVLRPNMTFIAEQPNKKIKLSNPGKTSVMANLVRKKATKTDGDSVSSTKTESNNSVSSTRTESNNSVSSTKTSSNNNVSSTQITTSTALGLLGSYDSSDSDD